MAKRYELTDAQWRRISELMLGKASDPGRTGSDNRRFVNGVLFYIEQFSNLMYSGIMIIMWLKFLSIFQIEKTLGPQVSGLVRGSGISWELGRKRGLSIGT